MQIFNVFVLKGSVAIHRPKREKCRGDGEGLRWYSKERRGVSRRQQSLEYYIALGGGGREFR